MKTTEIAFEEMLREHKNTIYTVCYMFSKDREEVNDLFQEVVINIWKGMPSFKGESNVKTWIWRISFNTCISLGRKKKRAEKVPLSMAIDLFNDGNEETRQIKQLYERIHRLQPFDRAIVLLWLEGLPYDEIGAIVGISTKNVSVRLYRIKEELKSMSNHKE
ncbi:MAG: sigma-70 family RNA polymerase sigma factor [Bacteroidaceae bacterium]|nr:sigma-70 family RNA polymerase sigma factor [Bacteroidaceae bacterium]MBQ2365808.1 sigma-70 family RNA polymerase sigma factor [Bacteroidaceae bacterium]